jgi:hypothetical protein
MVECPLAEVEARGLGATCLCGTEAEHEAAVGAVVRDADAAALARPAAAVIFAVLGVLATAAGYVRGRRAGSASQPEA